MGDKNPNKLKKKKKEKPAAIQTVLEPEKDTTKVKKKK